MIQAVWQVITVSTHSRLKAAGQLPARYMRRLLVSTHSRLKAAGQLRGQCRFAYRVSTHSRLKAAGILLRAACYLTCCFNTQPPKGGWKNFQSCLCGH